MTNLFIGKIVLHPRLTSTRPFVTVTALNASG
jgi:hypothetical protein